jgi:hypothetical protein
LTEDLEMTEFLVRFLASLLYGKNVAEKAFFFLGDGRNGKGTLVTLLTRALGNYFGNLDPSFYTARAHSVDAPNASLASVEYSRVINTSEVLAGTGQGATFLDAPLKRLSGNDTMTARAPYTRKVSRFVGGIPMIQCNAMPSFAGTASNTLALEQRLVIVELPFSFVEESDIPRDGPSRFRLRDNTVKARFESDPACKYALLSILFKKFAQLTEKFLNGTFMDGVETPQRVRDSGRAYFDQFNPTSGINGWLSDNVDKCHTATDSPPLDVHQLHCDFTTETSRTVTQKAFVALVTTKFGKRSTVRALRSTSFGCFSRDNSSLLQGYKRKEVLQPAALDGAFAAAADASEVGEAGETYETEYQAVLGDLQRNGEVNVAEEVDEADDAPAPN